MTTCTSSDCSAPADLAITTRVPINKDGLVTTIYQIPEDAPKKASWYCVNCGIELAAGLARLSNPEGADA